MFFDYLGIEYYYEYEGFQLPSGWYLPDFFLPEHGWFEIKPVEPNLKEQKTSYEFAAELRDKKHFLDINAEDMCNYSKSHYILIGFPLQQVFKPSSYMERWKKINSFQFGSLFKGNYWLDNASNDKIYFSFNIMNLVDHLYIDHLRDDDQYHLYSDI